MGFLDRLFSPHHGRGGSKEDAKSRLKVLLVHDQVDLTPSQMDAMKAEICEVIARYADVDLDRVDIRLERGLDDVRVTSSVPVRRVNVRPVHG